MTTDVIALFDGRTAHIDADAGPHQPHSTNR
jgi:hypothetical protein